MEMNYNNYMSGVKKFGSSNNFDRQSPARRSEYFQTRYEAQKLSRNKPYGISNVQQPATTNMFDYHKKNAFNDPLVSELYNKGLVQNQGDKIAAATFALNELTNRVNHINTFRNSAAFNDMIPELNRLNSVATSMNAYLNDLYKQGAAQYR